MTRKKKGVGILQPGYLPWLGFFEQMHCSDIFVFYDDARFSKGAWQNRNRIKSPQGPLWLSVPVESDAWTKRIRDVRIAPSGDWRRKHARSIAQNYQKARYFERYSHGLLAAIEDRSDFLLDLTMRLIIWLAKELGITAELRFSSDVSSEDGRVERLIGIVRQLGGERFYEGAAGRDYIDPAVFAANGIEVEFQDYRHPVYRQLHGEFISHLSIIDLLFNCGPDSLSILACGHAAIGDDA